MSGAGKVVIGQQSVQVRLKENAPPVSAKAYFCI